MVMALFDIRSLDDVALQIALGVRREARSAAFLQPRDEECRWLAPAEGVMQIEQPSPVGGWAIDEPDRLGARGWFPRGRRVETEARQSEDLTGANVVSSFPATRPLAARRRQNLAKRGFATTIFDRWVPTAGTMNRRPWSWCRRTKRITP